MSSDFYPACLSRNLVRTQAPEYRDNADSFLSVNDTASAKYQQKRVTAGFLAFPDFGGKKAKAIFGHVPVTLGLTSLRNVLLRPVQ